MHNAVTLKPNHSLCYMHLCFSHFDVFSCRFKESKCIQVRVGEPHSLRLYQRSSVGYFGLFEKKLINGLCSNEAWWVVKQNLTSMGKTGYFIWSMRQRESHDQCPERQFRLPRGDYHCDRCCRSFRAVKMLNFCRLPGVPSWPPSSVQMCARSKSPTCAACGIQTQVFFLSSGPCLTAKSLIPFHACGAPDQRQITVHLMVRIMQFKEWLIHS